MGTSAAVMNTLRIIGGAIGPIISGVIMQIFLSTCNSKWRGAIISWCSRIVRQVSVAPILMLRS